MRAEPRTDRIELRGVRAVGHHGVLAHERRDGQPFVVDLLLDVDLSRAAATDDLADTVSYADVAQEVVGLVEGQPHNLIETLAGRIADQVLRHTLVEAVEVVVHKPEAPIPVPFGDVTVRVRRERQAPVVIALGANLGSDPARTVRQAARRLARLRGLRGLRLSPLYRTEPVGGPDQPGFVNAVAVARARWAPATLLAALHDVEQDHGRTREVVWGPRTLDLDLIQYGTPGTEAEARSGDPALTLPHPRAHERAFVLLPWHRIDPAARLRLPEGEVVEVARVLERLDASGVRPLEGG